MRQIPSHQSVVSMIGYCISTRSMETCLLLEYCTNGDLRSYLLRRSTDLTPSMLLDFSVQIAEGMDHLARYKIVHRDLAARNVLISDEKRAKITDFGLSRATPLYYRKVTPGKVPWKWLAPESLAPIDSCYSSKSDVWSFGVVLHEIFSWGEAPWLQVERIDQLERLLHPQYGNHRMLKPVGCSNEMYVGFGNVVESFPDGRFFRQKKDLIYSPFFCLFSSEILLEATLFFYLQICKLDIPPISLQTSVPVEPGL